MAVIIFLDKPEHKWFVARWAYRQILEDVIAQSPEDAEIGSALSERMETDGLIMASLEPPLARRVTKAMRQVVEGILSGTFRSSIHDKSYGDQHTIQEYQKGLKHLLETIPCGAETKD